MTTPQGMLAPCPFCGSDAEIERQGTAKQSCIIACQGCGCRLESGEVWSMGERWNTRQAAAPQGREALERDAARYRRLQVLGCAPGLSKQLEAGTVLRFFGLDEFVDADIKAVPSRGEAFPAVAPDGAGEWRCFHCDEVFTDADAAKEHFGPDTEWQAGCVDPLTKDEQERRKDQVDMYAELDREREENSRLTNRDYILGCFESDLAKHFNGAKSVHQAFLVLDAMEGRALAAEEKLAALARQAQESIGEQQILDEASRRYLAGTHRRAFIEGAGWGLNNRTAQEPGEDKRTFNVRGKQVELSTHVDADLAAVLDAPPPQVDSGREEIARELLAFAEHQLDFAATLHPGLPALVKRARAALRPERSGGRG